MYLPPALVRRVKHAAIDEGLSPSALVEAALVEYVARHEGGSRGGVLMQVNEHDTDLYT